jgi:hypothetical protein
MQHTSTDELRERMRKHLRHQEVRDTDRHRGREHERGEHDPEPPQWAGAGGQHRSREPEAAGIQ